MYARKRLWAVKDKHRGPVLPKKAEKKPEAKKPVSEKAVADAKAAVAKKAEPTKKHLRNPRIGKARKYLPTVRRPRPVARHFTPKIAKLRKSLVPGTVPLDAPPTTVTLQRQEFGNITQLPIPLTADLLKRGQERFTIYCAVCHGATGSGDGMIVQRGFTPPPSFHIDRLRNVPIGHFVDAMTNGWGAMYSYADRVRLNDRWAIAAYIRALQLSQRAPLNVATPTTQQRSTEKQP
jgi:mono/diheme cytochrome c family protein